MAKVIEIQPLLDPAESPESRISEGFRPMLTLDPAGDLPPNAVDPTQSAEEAQASAGKLALAVDWLRAALADGPLGAADLEERARQAGISLGSYKRARTALRVQSVKSRTQDGVWITMLPPADEAMQGEAELVQASDELLLEQGNRWSEGWEIGDLQGQSVREAAEPAVTADALTAAQEQLTHAREQLQREQVVLTALEAALPSVTFAAMRGDVGAQTALDQLEGDLTASRKQVRRWALAVGEATRLAEAAVISHARLEEARRQEQRRGLEADRDRCYVKLEEAIEVLVVVVRELDGIAQGLGLAEHGRTAAKVSNRLNEQLWGAGLHEFRLPPPALRGRLVPLTQNADGDQT